MIGDGQTVLGVAGPVDQQGIVDEVESERGHVVRLVVEPGGGQDLVRLPPASRQRAERHARQQVEIDAGQVVAGPLRVILEHRLIEQVHSLVLVVAGRIELVGVDLRQVAGQDVVRRCQLNQSAGRQVVVQTDGQRFRVGHARYRLHHHQTDGQECDRY